MGALGGLVFLGTTSSPRKACVRWWLTLSGYGSFLSLLVSCHFFDHKVSSFPGQTTGTTSLYNSQRTCDPMVIKIDLLPFCFCAVPSTEAYGGRTIVDQEKMTASQCCQSLQSCVVRNRCISQFSLHCQNIRGSD